MPSITSLKTQLHTAYPYFTLVESTDFEWSPSTNTISYAPKGSHAVDRLLHEYSHAILGHSAYTRDIELLGLERDAWHYATTVLAPKYGVKMTPEVAQDDMDTYRDWLHARSTCPKCASVGMQSATTTYRCLVCRHTWRVNKALSCGLRRYTVK